LYRIFEDLLPYVTTRVLKTWLFTF